MVCSFNHAQCVRSSNSSPGHIVEENVLGIIIYINRNMKPNCFIFKEIFVRFVWMSEIGNCETGQ